MRFFDLKLLQIAAAIDYPMNGDYTARFGHFNAGSIEISITQSDLSDISTKRADVRVSTPLGTVMVVLNSPMAYLTTEGATRITLERDLLSEALTLTNPAIHRAFYQGNVTPERVVVYYYPRGRDGHGNPSIFITVTTDHLVGDSATVVLKKHAVWIDPSQVGLVDFAPEEN